MTLTALLCTEGALEGYQHCTPEYLDVLPLWLGGKCGAPADLAVQFTFSHLSAWKVNDRATWLHWHHVAGLAALLGQCHGGKNGGMHCLLDTPLRARGSVE